MASVQNVKVLGRGTIVYDGPQDPNSDEGWMQKPDWHCIGAYQAHNVEIDGLTCIVRSRTWSIQMKDSTGFRFDDLRLIGGNPVNANQDGMDWLGGGDTVVNNAFLRSSDDDLAMEGNWDGYSEADMLRPGARCRATSWSKTASSPPASPISCASDGREKTFNSRNFTLRDSDILHAGIGACGQTFGLLGFWGANGAQGDHSAFTFENLFLDNWYSLVQMEQEQPGSARIHLPQHLGARSAAAGRIHADRRRGRRDLRQREVRPKARDQRRRDAAGRLAAAPSRAAVIAPAARSAAFHVDPPRLRAGREGHVHCHALRPAPTTPGSSATEQQATGRRVRHRFPDA